MEARKKKQSGLEKIRLSFRKKIKRETVKKNVKNSKIIRGSSVQTKRNLGQIRIIKEKRHIIDTNLRGKPLSKKGTKMVEAGRFKMI